MFEIDGKDISLSRGDTLCFRVRLKNRTLPPGTNGLFTVKRRPRMDAEPLIEKTVGITGNLAEITLTAAETAALAGRTYYWDFRVIDPDGTVTTPMEYAGFTVTEVVGNVSGER